MPGSSTTPGHAGTRVDAPARVAFRCLNGVSAQDELSFAAQWLAYALPYRRFACTFTGTCARLGADAVGIEMRRALHLRVRWLIPWFPMGP